MAVIGPVELVVVAVLVVGLLVVLPDLLLRHVGRSVPVRREWRLVQLTRVLGLGVAFAAAQLAPGASGPAAFGLVLLLVVAVGETVVRPRRHPGPRVASLTPRLLRDYLPRRLTRVVGAASAVLVLLVVASAVLTRPDTVTGGSRLRGCSVPTSTQTGPVVVDAPLVLVLVAVLSAAVVAARTVALRPRGASEEGVDDDALRRRSLGIVVAATGVAVGLTLASVAGRLAGTLSSAGWSEAGCAPSWGQPVADVLFVCVFVASVVALWCVLELLAGRAARPLDSGSRDQATAP